MSTISDVMNMSNAEMDKVLESFVGKPRKEVEAELALIRQQIQEVANTIPDKGNPGEQGPQGIPGKDGLNGKNGRDGVNGSNGLDGKTGKDGKDGIDGKDGVSVTNAYLDFDNSLTLELSDGSIIDAGQFNLPENIQNIIQSLKQTGPSTLLSLDDVNVAGATNSQVLSYDAATNTWIPATVSGTGGGGSGTVTSVAMSVPLGLSVTGSPVTSAGTLALTYSAGYAIPTTANQTNWTTAYGWGNHATAGYLTSYTETDPVFVASAAYGITGTNITNWNTAYSWGNHASAGYLTSSAIGSTVQAYDADLTSWAAITPSTKQDTLVSGTNIKTINGSSILGSGNITISGGSTTPAGLNTEVQYNNSGAFGASSTYTFNGTTVTAPNFEAIGGLLADGAFGGTYVDGIVVDYDTVGAKGRISVGGADGLSFYNGGVAGAELGHVTTNGDWSLARFLDVGNGTLIGGATNPLIAAAGSVNGYVQNYIHNDLAGTSASADFAAYPDNGVDASGWIDMGITSSSYSDPSYTTTGANEGYIFMSAPSGSGTSGNLVYATDSTGSSNAHQWYVGGFGVAKSAYKMQLNATNLLVKQAIQANGVIESTTGGFKFPDATTQTTAASPFTGGTLTSQLVLKAGAAGAGAAPIEFQSGTLQTTAEAGAVEYDGTAFYNSMAASTRGVMPSEQLVVLTGTNTLTSQTAAQALFDGGGGTTNGAVTLPIGTYQFECSFALSGMSATSGSFGFALGGTATKTFSALAESAKTSALTTAVATQHLYITAAVTTLLSASNTNTTGSTLIRGIIRVTAAGTVIPQVSLTVASAAVIQANSYFKVSPVGNATVATVGNWS